MPLRQSRAARARGATAVLVALAATVLTAAVATPTGPVAAAPRPDPTYRPPVDAAVSDPFRAPDQPYGPGHRGIEYDTAPGTPVLAPADGRVTFAGWVAGTRHVTVLHLDGVRTTASYLAAVDVVVGQEVRQGDRLGTTAGRLHFGARQGDAYFDPATLFADRPAVVRLVPFDLPPGSGPGGERSAVAQLLGIGKAALGLAADGAGALAELAVDRALGHLFPVTARVRTALVASAARLAVDGLAGLVEAYQRWRRPCTGDDVVVAPPAERRVALLVGGLGSSSRSAAIDDLDVDTLGYEPADVLRFSYAGGRIPDPDVRLPGVPVAAYDAEDSHQDLRASGRRLADLVESVAAAAPGVPIDLLAHSQGGVVARLALAELEARHGAAWLDRVGLLATLATPHEGADLATLGANLDRHALGALALDGLEALSLPFDPRAVSVGQLAETSDVMRELAGTPLPEGVDALSIAARGDLVVPAPRTDLPGAVGAVVPLVGATAHDRLPGADRTAREVALALVGAPPRCVAWDTALADVVVGGSIGAVEDLPGTLAGAAAPR